MSKKSNEALIPSETLQYAGDSTTATPSSARDSTPRWTLSNGRAAESVSAKVLVPDARSLAPISILSHLFGNLDLMDLSSREFKGTKYFMFDTPSPDDIVRQSQSKVLERGY